MDPNDRSIECDKEEVTMKVKEIAKTFNISEGRIRGVLKTWKPGQIVTEFNLEGLKEYLVGKFGEAECEAKLGYPISQLTIELGQRSEATESLSIDELEEGESYVLRNYHFETNAEYVGATEVNGIELWIFKTDKGYKAYADEDINNGHFKILAE